MSDWLTRTVDTFSEFESPKRFYYWSCLAAVSAILKDRVYHDMFLYKLYPSIYVLLYGPSGIKKGPPIALAKDIVSYLDVTRVINGRSTVEAIMKELGTVRSRKNGKGPLNDSCGFIISSEMSSALVSNTNSLDILTDLFDRIYNNGEWIYRLKNSEPITLKNPTITWLAGTNESLFRDFVPEKNLKGGLIGRTFVISEHKGGKVNSLMYRPKVEIDRAKIAKELEPLLELKGEFQVADSIRAEFDSWYLNFKENIFPKLEDETGTAERIADNIFKLAMLISCARRADMILTIDDIEEAMKEILTLIAPSKKISNNARQNEINSAEKRSLILQYLANKEGCKDTKVNILRKFILKMDHEDLDRIAQSLETAKVLNIERAGGVVSYALNMNNKDVQEYVEQYRR